MTRRASALLLAILIPLAICPGQSWIDTSLARLETQYAQTQEHKTVEALIALDTSIGMFVHRVHEAIPDSPHVRFWEDQYTDLGLFIGRLSDQFGYTGRFLLEAHQLNPQSAFRRYTLYATIMGLEDWSELIDMPNVDSALAYIKEFPGGPYAVLVYMTLGDFYKDLYMLLRDFEKEKNQGYKYDCYKRYVDEASPIDMQRDLAQKLSLQYYDEALKLDPDNQIVLPFRKQVHDGTVNYWSYCTD